MPSLFTRIIDGEIRVTPGRRPWQIATNDIVCGKSEVDRRSGCPRYRTGSDTAEELGGVFDYADARRVARSMSVDNRTMWTSVYDLTTREARILYKSHPDTEYRDAIP